MDEESAFHLQQHEDQQHLVFRLWAFFPLSHRNSVNQHEKFTFSRFSLLFCIYLQYLTTVHQSRGVKSWIFTKLQSSKVNIHQWPALTLR